MTPLRYAIDRIARCGEAGQSIGSAAAAQGATPEPPGAVLQRLFGGQWPQGVPVSEGGWCGANGLGLGEVALALRRTQAVAWEGDPAAQRRPGRSQLHFDEKRTEMKARVSTILALVMICALLGSAGPLHGSAVSQVIAVGQLRWTRISVCEHPLFPGLFLHYYLADGCQNQLFLYGSLTQGMIGSTIWAEGTLLQNGACKILDITSFSLCQGPSPSD